MTEAPSTYRFSPSVGPLPPGQPRIVEPPLSPRVRLLVIGLRRVLLLAADVLGEFAELPKRE